jgi:hypothetical protein
MVEREGAFIERFGIGVAAEVFVQPGQVAPRDGNIAVLGPSAFSR